MLLYQEITDIIIQTFYKVYNELGLGFLEKVYEDALIIELRPHSLNACSQVPVSVFYKANLGDNYFADILIIVELKREKKDLLKKMNYS